MTLRPATVVKRVPLKASSTVEDITPVAKLVFENPWWNPSWLRPVGVAVCAIAVAVKTIVPGTPAGECASHIVDTCTVLGLASVGVSTLSEHK